MSEVYRKCDYLLEAKTRRKTEYHDFTVIAESSIFGGTALGLYPEQVQRELEEKTACTRAQMLIKGAGNQLPPPKSFPPLANTASGFYTARWVFFTQLLFHAIPSVIPAFIEPIPLRAHLPILG